MRKYIVAAIIFELIGLFGCKKDDTSTNDHNAGTSISIPVATFKVPSSGVSDSYLTRTKNDISSMNDLMETVGQFASLPTPTTQNGNIYTWSFDGGTEIITGIKQPDGSFTWTMVYNGTFGTVTYDHYKIWDGTTSADGKTGYWEFYSHPSTTSNGNLGYSIDTSGVLTGTHQVYFVGTLVMNKTVVTNNADGSGELDEYGANGNGILLVFKAVWAANGSGTWWTYTSGTQSGTGTWS